MKIAGNLLIRGPIKSGKSTLAAIIKRGIQSSGDNQVPFVLEIWNMEHKNITPREISNIQKAGRPLIIVGDNEELKRVKLSRWGISNITHEITLVAIKATKTRTQG